ncbi:hypothetical protein HanRHA438_Chr04g0153781 [Helianthus annuus]|nr:hypothetical protein HanIR_Chr04g0154021 [Helianthus annuus]KAJ0924916.1 hypothetical protein HanRHA438_Chr04g0153781 [Helianthus annuus]
MGPDNKFSEMSRNVNEVVPQGNGPSKLLFLNTSSEMMLTLLIQLGIKPVKKLLLISKRPKEPVTAKFPILPVKLLLSK